MLNTAILGITDKKFFLAVMGPYEIGLHVQSQTDPACSCKYINFQSHYTVLLSDGRGILLTTADSQLRSSADMRKLRQSILGVVYDGLFTFVPSKCTLPAVDVRTLYIIQPL